MPQLKLFLNPSTCRTFTSQQPNVSVSLTDTVGFINYSDVFLVATVVTASVNFRSIPQVYLLYVGIIIVDDVHYYVENAFWIPNVSRTVFYLTVRKLSNIISN